jgi:hypothetical protein
MNVRLGLGLLFGLTTFSLYLALRTQPARHPKQAAYLLVRLDLDGDGRVSTEECRRLSRPNSPSWDLDGDGWISEAELEALLRAVDPLWAHSNPTSPDAPRSGDPAQP